MKPSNSIETMNLSTTDGIDTAKLIAELGWQFRVSRSLLAAHQAGFFEALRSPKTAVQLSLAQSTDAEVTEKVLIAMCALGLLDRRDDTYSLTDLARDIMLPESVRYIGGALDFSEYMWWEWSVLPDMLRGGKKYTERHRLMKQLQSGASYVSGPEYFTLAMHGKAVNGGAQFMVEHVDLCGRHLLVDIGGGPGTYSVAFCQRFPQLKAVVWDQPQPLEVARQVVKHYELNDRIRLQPGDWENDEFTHGGDVILLSNVIHGPRSNAPTILAKAFRALRPGGLLIVQEFLLNSQKTGPIPAAVFNIMVGAFSESELIDLISSAGFTGARLLATDPIVGSGIVTASKPL
ncbi:dimerization domain-containing protein [Dehalogenimonas formicexedens]|uniref:Dimerization domain-containing protein n=1 Tax=Dehalogenimonas formicexedens TaxID=1839801 RepID=A0A1P8F8X4_9CHLR|nr:methyltransferase [Dehalogenimonas formicexedens]APV44921.1 dimerization domain-containing protein [Dehalogenimonas formicexedens]